MEMQITQAHPRHLETGIVGDGVKEKWRNSRLK